MSLSINYDPSLAPAAMQRLAEELAERRDLSPLFSSSGTGITQAWLVDALSKHGDRLAPRGLLYLHHFVKYLSEPENWISLWDQSNVFHVKQDRLAGRLAALAQNALQEIPAHTVRLPDWMHEDCLIGGAPSSLELQDVRYCIALASYERSEELPPADTDALRAFKMAVSHALHPLIDDWKDQIEHYGARGPKASRLLRRRLHCSDPTRGDRLWRWGGPTFLDVALKTARKQAVTVEVFPAWYHSTLMEAEHFVNSPPQRAGSYQAVAAPTHASLSGGVQRAKSSTF